MQPFPTLRTITADPQDDVLVVRILRAQMLDDRIDELRRECTAVVDEYKPRWVVLDLSQVWTISSTGVSAVINLLKRARAHGGDLVLCGLSPVVEQVFRLCQLVSDDPAETALRVFREADEAVAARKAA
jgi:anti-anti-sigma factor